MDWVWWLAAALLLAVAEMLSLDFVLIMLATGAAVAALLAAMGFPVWVQFLGFAVTSGALLLALRPWLLDRLRRRVPLVETNVHALVGQTAIVLSEVSDRAGRVKLAGEVWTARTDGEHLLPVGEEVVVTRIDGATAVVSRAAHLYRGSDEPVDPPSGAHGVVPPRPNEETL